MNRTAGTSVTINRPRILICQELVCDEFADQILIACLCGFGGPGAQVIPLQRRGYGRRPAKIEKLMGDAGIVRNRAKIEGTVLSARAWLDAMEKGPGFSNLLWDFVDGKPKVNNFKTTGQVPAETATSRAMSKELAQRGFKFCGPTIVYAFMQAVGMVNDHLISCYRHDAVAKLGHQAGA